MGKPIIIKEWDTIKWAFREAWKIDAKNMLFWSIVSMAAGLIPSFLLTAVEGIVNSIPTAVQQGLPFYYFVTRAGLIALLWIAHTTYGRVRYAYVYNANQICYSHAAQIHKFHCQNSAYIL